MDFLKLLFGAPASSADSDQDSSIGVQPAPRLLDAAEVAAVAGGPMTQNDG
ncbi:hypothetical protein [Roseateles sp.]|uniref:hypothetical protein n=1 Tax=Roseateles sp. TaxID=1971397 RepID=UPI002E05279F|nr:hypothetical protein [Roseateles sp.]